MNESIKKINEEIAEKMKATFSSKAFLDSIKAIKEASAEDTGTFRMVISTDDVDRHGEIVVQEGINTDNYLQNPIVLWGHNSWECPVGMTTKIYLEKDGTKTKTIAEGKFAPTEDGQELRKLYEAGMLNTSSIGFIPLEYEGNKITKCELLEWSFVSIPANPYAQAIRSMGLSISKLVEKGVMTLKEGESIETSENGEEKIVEEPKKDEEEKKPEGDEPKEAIEGTMDNIVVNEDEKTFTVNVAEGKSIKFSMTEEFMKSLKERFFAEEKAGRVLSKANLEKVKSAISALEEVVKIAEDTSEEEGKSADDVNGSEGETKLDDKEQETKDFLVLRRALQNIATDASKVLSDAKTFAKERGIKTR